MKPKRSRLLGSAVSATLAVGLLAAGGGCGSGSGSGSGPITNCSLTLFTPNYAASVSHLLQWSGFPVTVYFIQDANYSANRRALALAGFDQWVNATGGAVSYQVTTDQSAADITVTFDPKTANGLTNLHFTGLTMNHADMDVGVQDLPDADVQCVAAHEFGHAIGIDGHSPDQGDLMYFAHFVGESCPVTQRDLNTLKTGYCGLFSRAARPRTRPIGPEQTLAIQ